MTDRRLKVGFVGCGGISQSLYTGVYGSLCEIAQVVAVADLVDDLTASRSSALKNVYLAEAHAARVAADNARTDDARLAALRRAEAAESAAASDVRRYRTHEELIRDDEVQVVCVFTPPAIRMVPIVAAAQAGKHVYTEGPFARSVEEADAIVDAARNAGVKFHAQVVDRYTRGMVLAHHAVERGLLGPLGSANVELNMYRGQSYYGPVGKSGELMPRGWMGTWAGEGGGAVFHHGRYIIDPYLWVVGSRVAEVFAYSGPMLRNIEHDSLTQAVVKFENGATGYIHATLISHLDGNIPGPRGRITLLGRDAAIEIIQNEQLAGSTTAGDDRYLTSSDLTIASRDNPEAVEAIESLKGELADYPDDVTQEDQTRYFLESILNDTEPVVPIDVPHHHVEVTRAIYKSAAEGRPVTLPLEKNDPFYTFEGRLPGASAAGRPKFSSGHEMKT